MYIWKTQELTSDLKEGRVAEKEKLKYVVFLGVAYAIFSDPLFSIGVEYSYIDVINLIVVILITALGTIYVYKKNKDGDNIDFITRFTCLSVPVGVKIFLLALITGILVAVFEVALLVEDIETVDESFVMPTSPSVVVATTIIMVLFYYLLGRRVSEVAASNIAPNE